jgi:hypothetical protein
VANATAVTVNTMVANAAGAADPTPDVLDTGTAAVTIAIPATVGSRSGRVLLRVKNTGAQTATFSVLAGDSPPSERAGVGALATTLLTTVTKWIGPLDAGRFIQDDGTINVTMTPSSGTIGAEITCFLLPKYA